MVAQDRAEEGHVVAVPEAGGGEEGDIIHEPHLVEPQWENTIPEDLVDHPMLLAMQESHSPFLVTDPRLPGNPIIYVNNGFLDMTGYAQHRCLGRNCRFMQGPETDPVVVAKMRDAVDDGRDVTVTLLNYRADGSTFYNHIVISTIKDPVSKEVKYYLGLTEEVATPHDQNPRIVAIPVSDPEEGEHAM